MVLPANFPNLLANGTSGIAVGMATSIPPHNVDELCTALLHLIKHPNATIDKLVEIVPGPDFPTGGIIVEPREQILEAYKTGRGGFRLRARWEKEDTGRGTYQIVVTEIPYQVQKAKLVERLAELIDEKKLPLLGDVRDELAETVRLVLEPKSRTVDPDGADGEPVQADRARGALLAQHERAVRRGQVPGVLSLRDVLKRWLDHRQVVLVRRSQFRLEKIEHRLEVLDGYLIAYLNLDEVIRIVRFEDEPKAKLIKRFKLTEVQAEAILNLRLKSLSQARGDRDQGRARQAQQGAARAQVAAQVRRPAVGAHRRGGEGDARGLLQEDRARPPPHAPSPTRPAIEVDLEQAMIEKEPITVILSEKGWIRAMKGHMDDLSKLEFKQGDSLQRAVKAQTTDKLLLLATNGKVFTLPGDQLPGGRGHGEPVRLMVDLEENHDVRRDLRARARAASC